MLEKCYKPYFELPKWNTKPNSKNQIFCIYFLATPARHPPPAPGISLHLPGNRLDLYKIVLDVSRNWAHKHLVSRDSFFYKYEN